MTIARMSDLPSSKRIICISLLWLGFVSPFHYIIDPSHGQAVLNPFLIFFFFCPDGEAMNDSFVRKFHRFGRSFVIGLTGSPRPLVGKLRYSLSPFPLYYAPTIWNTLISCLYFRDKCWQRNICIAYSPDGIWAEKIGNKDSPQSPCDILQLLQSGESCGNPVNIFLPQQLYSTLYGSRKSGRMERQEKKRDMEQWKS